MCGLRRDLRLDEHATPSHALASGVPVRPIFLFDPDILATLKERM